MKYYGITDRGLLRKTNQDSYVIATNQAGDVLAIVCDGIGGSNGGDVASALAVRHFSEAFSQNTGFASGEEAKAWLRREIQTCNARIFTAGSRNKTLHGMGTTLSGVLMAKACTLVINIGDSRVYSLDDEGSLRQMTVDHSLVQDMIMHGEITPKEARTYPKKNVLTNALGVWESVRCDIDTHPEPMKAILICSDGLHGYVPEDTIRKIIVTEAISTQLKARGLVQAALAAGGYDNVTVILIEPEGDEGE